MDSNDTLQLAKCSLAHKKEPLDTFFFNNQKSNGALRLNPQQMRTFVKVLPEGLKSCKDVDESIKAGENKFSEGIFWRELIREDKISSLRLEGNIYEGKPYIWLRPYYKAMEKTLAEQAKEEAVEAALQQANGHEEEEDDYFRAIDMAIKKQKVPSTVNWNVGKGACMLVLEDLEPIKKFFFDKMIPN